SGQFLLDSESRLREASMKFMEPGLVADAIPSTSPTEAATATSEGRLYYVCPMPEHVDVLYDHPGACPLCGMQMVPVQRAVGAAQVTPSEGGDHVHPR